MEGIEATSTSSPVFERGIYGSLEDILLLFDHMYQSIIRIPSISSVWINVSLSC